MLLFQNEVHYLLCSVNRMRRTTSGKGHKVSVTFYLCYHDKNRSQGTCLTGVYIIKASF